MIFQKLIGIVPLGVGISVILFAWTQPFDEFGSIPIFLRFFMSFVALFFVLIGAKIMTVRAPFSPEDSHELMDELKQGGLSQRIDQSSADGPAITKTVYECPGCGSPIQDNSDVSPHGDVKCSHCGRWFNIHGG